MVKISVSEKMKIKFIIVFSVVSFVAMIWGLYSLSNVASIVLANKVRTAEVKRDVELLDRIFEDRKEYGDDIAKVKSSFPSSVYDVSFFAVQLEKLAESKEIVLTLKFDQKEKEEKALYDSITVSLDARGKYLNISEYLSEITKLPYHTEIAQMEINGKDGVTSAKVKLKLFTEK